MSRDYKYQKDLSLVSPVLLDESHKSVKVKKMLAVLDSAGLLCGGELVVDVGCSAGFFIRALASYFNCAIGIDIDNLALVKARSISDGFGAFFIESDSMKLPFSNDEVDLVICNHVYEHVPDSVKLFEEIERVLKPGGVCYFGAASKYTVIEPHYHLPFLSWLPKWLAHKYMRLFGKGDFYYENLRSRSGLQGLIKNFLIEDFTLKIINDPDKYCAREMIPRGGFADRIPFWLWKIGYRLLPSYILLLKKK